MNKRLLLVTVFVFFSVFVLSIGLAFSQAGDLPTWDELESGWNTILPGGDTICAYGTEYSFHVHPADSDNLLIFFNGGGACWFGQICDPAGPTFVPFTNDVPQPTGIFDLENEANPFWDYNMVFISYCTGDVHLGNNVVDYDVPATEDTEAAAFTVFHNGYVNAMTVLDWVFENVEAPENIFVTGSSAGAIASPFYAGIVAEQYPDSTVTQLGDGAGGYRIPQNTELINTVWNTPSILPDWEEYADITAENQTFEAYYVATGTRFPEMAMAQYNTANDETQYLFLGLNGITDVPLLNLLEANFEDIRTNIDSFYTYTAGGSLHTILRFPEFYTYVVDDVPVSDWVGALADGEAAGDVQCMDCENPPVSAEE